MTDTLRDRLTGMGFRRMGRIYTLGESKKVKASTSKRPDDSLVFIVDPDVETLYKSAEPALYVWLSEGQEKPWYVGKAGMGLKTRWDQWVGGFYGTSDARAKAASGGKPATGIGMAQRIRQQPAGAVEVWARAAGTISLLGFAGSLVSAEEEILIGLLDPRWNNGKDEPETSPEE